MKIFKFILFYDKVILMLVLISVSGNDSPKGIRNLNLNNSDNQDDNYLIIQYKSRQQLNFMNFDYFENIRYIKIGDQNFSSNDRIRVDANTDIEIHFIEVFRNLYFFFKDATATYKNIISVNFSHFDTSLVTNMSHLFYECQDLQSLDLSNFNTSLVTDMSYMFYLCKNLLSLDLSNLNASLVIDMRYMFYSCTNLQSLDLTNFKTSLVVDITYIFNQCQSLQSLNLSTFDTSLVTNMRSMFNGCASLKYLYLNFNTSLLKDMGYMFQKCKSLQILNLSNFDTTSVSAMDSFLMNVLL